MPSLLFEASKWWNSPYINHFISADTIIPDQTNTQAWNRYSYVTNNPLRYTDPTGHWADEGCGTGGSGGGTGCNLPPSLPPPNPPSGGNGNNNNGVTKPVVSTTVPSIPYSPPCVGIPINEGNLISGYCGGGGSLATYSTNGQNVEAVFITYSSSADVLVYENAMVITLQEQYFLPSSSVPLGESSTFGYSNLESQLANGAIAETPLGNFTPTNNKILTRYTTITYYGKHNFPTQLAVAITFGGDSVGATTVVYHLPFGQQVVTNE